MAILRGLLVLFVLFGSIPSGNTQNVTDETTVAEDTTTEAVISVTTETSTAMEADTTESSTNVTVAMVTNATTTVMMTTTAEMETEQTTMETTTMYIPMTTLAPIILTNCTDNDTCTASNSICNIAIGVCQCEDKYVLVNDTICRTVDAFKANVTFKNVTDNSVLVDWTTVDISGVDVYYEVIFNNTTLLNISAPPQLITNLSNGEVQSVQVTSIVKGRDDRTETVMSEVSLIRTAPLMPIFNNSIPYEAPNVTIMWTPRNPDVDLYYIYLKPEGHGTMSVDNPTNETSLSLTDLKPGTNYMFTVIQQTNGPYASNSSEATLNIRTESTEPGPPTAVEVVDAGQRNISINVTDTDTPNGDIIGYRFHIMYKFYPDEVTYRVNTDFLRKMMSNIYVLERHIYPGVQYKIAVFTVNDAFNSSSNVTLQDITTLPDTPGQVESYSSSNNKTTSYAVISWRRPSHPNGNMKAYRAVLDSGPDITSCRIYYLCLDVCNNTILGPPKDTCTISNDTTLMEHQTIMYLLVDNLRLGTTYTLSVVGYNEAGEGKNPRRVSLTTKSKRPDQVEIGSFNFDKQRYIVTWRSPSFPGEDLRYNVSLEDALREYVVLSSNNRNETSFSLPNTLHKFYNYTVVVVAQTSAGAANPTRYPFRTPYGGKLGAPQGPKIIEYTCERIKITWFEPDVRVRNGPITGYKFKNKDGNEVWTYTISRPEYWATQSKQFTHDLNIKQLTSYFIEIYAFSSISNQEANIITIRKFQSTECPKDNTPEIVGIVFAFLILLGICLAVIIFVYRKKVREIALLLTGTSSFTSDINGRPTRCFATSFALDLSFDIKKKGLAPQIRGPKGFRTEDLIVARNEIVSSIQFRKRHDDEEQHTERALELSPLIQTDEYDNTALIVQVNEEEKKKKETFNVQNNYTHYAKKWYLSKPALSFLVEKSSENTHILQQNINLSKLGESS
eukprot:XP_011415548.2 PREDICTED: phosphatidylinositol phosphatase PTPRQ [Crassostrea gigas]